jgi:carbon storage regulator
MLVLSRKPGEKIIIGDKITLTVVSIQGDRVRLGIEAPRDIPILREGLTPRTEPTQDEPKTPLPPC